MKQIFLSVFLLQIFFIGSGQTNFYVAINGNDNNAGTLAKPFKTIETALGRVATAKETKVNIFLRAGRCGLSKTIVLSPALLNHHQLEISSFNNEPVTFSG